MPWIRLTPEQQLRKTRWKDVHVPRVRQATRPNNAYIDRPEVLSVLQQLSDGLRQVLMTRPLRPWPWLADYLRRVCKLGHVVEQDSQVVLMLEMHKKRRVIQNTLLDTKADEVASKQLIRRIQTQQIALDLPPEELRLDDDDQVFLETEIPQEQSQWSVDVSAITLPPEQATESMDKWIATHLAPQRDLNAYFDVVLRGVTQALVGLELAGPENPAEWIVHCFQQMGASAEPPAALTTFFKTNYELLRKIEELKAAQRVMHLRRERLEEIHHTLDDELAVRARFIEKLRTCHVTVRTQAIMEGTPVFLNGQKHWVLPGSLLVPSQLTQDELVGLQRAERFLMEEDERRWKYLLRQQLEYDSCVRIQAAYKCWIAYRAYQIVTSQRHHAATILQRNYFHYLYHRAIRLPAWCVVGQEVVVAPSIAQKCATTFQFYAKKDFPTGNYKRLEGLSVAALMEICRQDEECAAFSTDGALKRFVPRKLSQLKPMSETTRPLTLSDGIYVKVYPAKTDKVVNTGIITAIPEGRFGLIRVVLDGIGITEDVPVQKLSDRWRKVRIRRHKRVEKRKPKAFVFGGVQLDERQLALETERHSDHAYDVLDVDEDEEEMARRRRRRRGEEDDPLLDFVFEDVSTKEVREVEPIHTYPDNEDRVHVINTRRQAYEAEKAVEYEAKKLASAVRLQCAWRSKRAREAFRRVLELRAKEKDRERLVADVHATHTRQHKPKAQPRRGFLSRFLGSRR
ncbi:hypothetical protein Poli38472_014011 [Pythium oligandrum]|uniref:Uncharacterized protein n=1 Tax=Pythium oligandrum TaxID=41045 RepID=A0A8K1CNF7_PYTOL|nr:hypothetical protein Poli38472_014011 [Pythium oligandrum]|eukprot:TMW66699.1 hypothetical protein Poli38472_014011 [Pythium oligandrum]